MPKTPKRHKTARATLELPLYGVCFYALTARDEWATAAADVYGEDATVEPLPLGVDGFVYCDEAKPGMALVFVDATLPEGPALAGACAHEAAHLTDFVCDFIGHAPDRSVWDEPTAYLTGYLTGRLYSLCASRVGV